MAVVASDYTLPPEDSRERPYVRVLSTIAHNTGYDQPLTIAASALWQLCGRLSHTRDETRRAVQAARESDAAIRFRAGGEYQYALQRGAYADLPFEYPDYPASDRERFETLLDHEVALADPRPSVVGWCNRHLQALDASEGSE